MEIVEGKNTVEYMFFIYALPALSSCCGDDVDCSKLESLAREGKALSREEMQKLVPKAFERMLQTVGEDYWTLEGVRKYWWVEHNKIIDNRGEGYEHTIHEQRESCKVKFWKVENLEEKLINLAGNKESGQAANTMDYLLKPGDYVTTHLGKIIEIITEKEFSEYG